MKKSERLQCRSSSSESNTAVSLTAVFQFKPTVTFLSDPANSSSLGYVQKRGKRNSQSLLKETCNCVYVVANLLCHFSLCNPRRSVS